MTGSGPPFFDMTQAEHAYSLGVIAAAQGADEGSVDLGRRVTKSPFVKLLNREFDEGRVMLEARVRSVRVHLPLAQEAAFYLSVPPGSGEEISFPSLSKDLTWVFLRGLFDQRGSVSSPKTERLVVRFPVCSEAFANSLLSFVENAPTSKLDGVLCWEGVAALDFLGHLYSGASNDSGLILARAKHLKRFRKWCHSVSSFAPRDTFWGTVLVQRTHPEAVIPKKERVSDSGYDLTLLYEKKRVGRVVLYGTGVSVEPPQGWYFDVVPRSSIIKRGYMIANNVGVIDRSYRGEILVPLIKVDERAPELELPARVAQMIPRPIMHFEIHEGAQLSATHRGEGGFGSSGS